MEWAYEGLKIWELAAREHGLVWRAPSYEEFIKDVVDKIEEFTKRDEETPAVDFINWLATYLPKNQELYGKEYMPRKDLKWGGKIYKGTIITESIIRVYRERVKDPRVTNSGELATSIQSITGIPKDVLRKSWYFIKAKVEGDKDVIKWGVFIPSDFWKFTGAKNAVVEERIDDGADNIEEKTDGEYTPTLKDDIDENEKKDNVERVKF